MTLIRRTTARMTEMLRAPRHFAEHMQGQDVERPREGRRSNTDYAALLNSRSSQGVTGIGLGR